MPHGVYAALSGLQARADRLDRLAVDIANSSTAGYKIERAGARVAGRGSFASVLDSVFDVVAGAPRTNFATGPLVPTGRDLDFAIEGPGFFSVQTPAGVRYTRNGHFTRLADGTVTTVDGSPLLGESGSPLKLPPGSLEIGPDGTLRVGKTTVGRPAVTVFEEPERLIREDGVHFRAPDDLAGEANTDGTIRAGSLEQSNVAMAESMAQLTDVVRGFEALHRGISVLMNDMDGRAITELGRR
ncbi:MAG: flagellar hook basal-body protein [Acidobacteriota bacterium]